MSETDIGPRTGSKPHPPLRYCRPRDRRHGNVHLPVATLRCPSHQKDVQGSPECLRLFPTSCPLSSRMRLHSLQVTWRRSIRTLSLMCSMAISVYARAEAMTLVDSVVYDVCRAVSTHLATNTTAMVLVRVCGLHVHLTYLARSTRIPALTTLDHFFRQGRVSCCMYTKLVLRIPLRIFFTA